MKTRCLVLITISLVWIKSSSGRIEIKRSSYLTSVSKSDFNNQFSQKWNSRLGTGNTRTFHKRLDDDDSYKSNFNYKRTLYEDMKPPTREQSANAIKINSRTYFDDEKAKRRVVPIQMNKIYKFPAKKHSNLVYGDNLAPNPIYVRSPPKAIAIPVHKVPLIPNKSKTSNPQIEPSKPVVSHDIQKKTKKEIFLENPAPISYPVKQVVPQKRQERNIFDAIRRPARPLSLPTLEISDHRKKKVMKFYKPIYFKSAPKIVPVPIYKVLTIPNSKRKRPVSIFRTVYMNMPVKRIRSVPELQFDDIQPSTIAPVNLIVKQFPGKNQPCNCKRNVKKEDMNAQESHGTHFSEHYG